jgi:capsid protein
MTTVPMGWRMEQFEAEQPTATHDQFQQTILREIFHCLNMPYSVGSGDYSKDSYSSGRLGLQTYLRVVRQARHHMKLIVLDRIFRAWLAEAVMIVPVTKQEVATLKHDWYFDPFASIDPVKDATADEMDLKNGVTTQMELCAERKRDWRKINRQRQREIQDQKAKGIFVEVKPSAAQPTSDTEEVANAA